MKALITGIDGSAAQYLADHLVDELVEVHGTSRRLSHNEKYTVHQCDLCDFSSVFNVLKKVEPDFIFHLAANADVKMSFTNPSAVLNNNVNNTLPLLESIRILGQNPLFQMCSTSEVYGNVDTYPIDESYPLNPANIYAISKLTQEKLAKFYRDAYNTRVVITRAFGYINPKRRNIFSTAFAIQIAQIEKGLLPPKIVHGNLDSVRTLLDVRDIARAYWKAAQMCRYGVPYNIGSENPVKVGYILDKLIVNSMFPDIELELNPELLRPNDVTLQIPSTKLFSQATDFVPKYTLDESIQELLNYCRKHYA